MLISFVSLAGFAMVAAAAGAAPAADPAQALFAAHCQACHAGDKHKGDFRIESLSPDFADRPNRERWLGVIEQLRSGDMPPTNKPRPPEADVRALVDWIGERARVAELARRAAHGRLVLRRPNRAEYATSSRSRPTRCA